MGPPRGPRKGLAGAGVWGQWLSKPRDRRRASGGAAVVRIRRETPQRVERRALVYPGSEPSMRRTSLGIALALLILGCGFDSGPTTPEEPDVALPGLEL